MEQFNNLDFSRFIPITNRSTNKLFIMAVDENPDLDNADLEEKFTCYPITESSEADFLAPIVLPRKNVDLMFIRIR